MLNRFGLVVTSLMLLAGVVAMPEGNVRAQAPKAGGMLRFAVRAEPSTLDPHRGSSGSDHMSLYPIYDTLVRFDPNSMAPQPGWPPSRQWRS